MAAVMAKWGTARFAVSRKQVVPLMDLAFSYEQRENKVTKKQRKKYPERKWKTRELMELTFSTRLIAGALPKGKTIRKEIKAWKERVTQVHYLAIGGKKFGPAFQLAKVDVSNVIIDDLGRFRSADLAFSFQEYSKKKTTVKVTLSAKKLKAEKHYKVSKKKPNIKLRRAQLLHIRAGDYIIITGGKYLNGAKIPKKQLKRKHKVVQYVENANKILIKVSGNNRWVKLTDVSLATGGYLHDAPSIGIISGT